MAKKKNTKKKPAQKPVKITVPVLSYADYSKFQCTGSDCPDNCCRPSTWSITVDDKTRKKYEALETEFGKEILESIDSSGAVPRMKKTENGNCIMLDENKLCKIQATLGASYLSNTCTQYPRSNYYYNGTLNMSIDISCPEVAKLLLLCKDGIEFGMSETKVNEKPPVPTKRADHLSEKLCFAIRGAVADLLARRSPGLSLLDKIIFIGLLFESIKKLGTDEPAIYKVIKLYEDALDQKDILASAKHAAELLDRDIKTAYYKAFFNTCQTIIKHETTLGVKPEFYDRIRELNACPDPDDGMDLWEGKRRLLDDYMRENEFVFQNYLTTKIFAKKFPADDLSIGDSYKSLILNYILLQTFIVFMNYDKEKLSDDDVLTCIYYFERHTAHNAAYTKKLEKLLADNSNINNGILACLL